MTKKKKAWAKPPEKKLESLEEALAEVKPSAAEQAQADLEARAKFTAQHLPPDVAAQAAPPEHHGLGYTDLDRRRLAGCVQRCAQLEMLLSRISPAGQPGLVAITRAALLGMAADFRKVLGD